MKDDLVFKDYSEFIQYLSKKIESNIKITDLKMCNSALLAYIGDAVYELFIRAYLINEGDSQVGKLHRKAVQFVEAKQQARIIDKIQKYLTEEEKNIVKRGRNAKTTSMPKNAKLIDYKYATGFESLLGYLFLNSRIDRLLEVLNYAIEVDCF